MPTISNVPENIKDDSKSTANPKKRVPIKALEKQNKHKGEEKKCDTEITNNVTPLTEEQMIEHEFSKILGHFMQGSHLQVLSDHFLNKLRWEVDGNEFLKSKSEKVNKIISDLQKLLETEKFIRKSFKFNVETLLEEKGKLKDVATHNIKIMVEKNEAILMELQDMQRKRVDQIDKDYQNQLKSNEDVSTRISIISKLQQELSLMDDFAEKTKLFNKLTDDQENLIRGQLLKHESSLQKFYFRSDSKEYRRKEQEISDLKQHLQSNQNTLIKTINSFLTMLKDKAHGQDKRIEQLEIIKNLRNKITPAASLSSLEGFLNDANSVDTKHDNTLEMEKAELINLIKTKLTPENGQSTTASKHQEYKAIAKKEKSKEKANGESHTETFNFTKNTEKQVVKSDEKVTNSEENHVENSENVCEKGMNFTGSDSLEDVNTLSKEVQELKLTDNYNLEVAEKPLGSTTIFQEGEHDNHASKMDSSSIYGKQDLDDITPQEDKETVNSPADDKDDQPEGTPRKQSKPEIKKRKKDLEHSLDDIKKKAAALITCDLDPEKKLRKLEDYKREIEIKSMRLEGTTSKSSEVLNNLLEIEESIKQQVANPQLVTEDISENILNLNHHFTDFNVEYLGVPKESAEFINKIKERAQSFEEKVSNYVGTNYSVEFFVIDENLMQLLEKLDSVKCHNEKELLKEKIEVINYIKNLHQQLDSNATKD